MEPVYWFLREFFQVFIDLPADVVDPGPKIIKLTSETSLNLKHLIGWNGDWFAIYANQMLEIETGLQI
jgi:hypothetical protein